MTKVSVLAGRSGGAADLNRDRFWRNETAAQALSLFEALFFGASPPPPSNFVVVSQHLRVLKVNFFSR